MKCTALRSIKVVVFFGEDLRDEHTQHPIHPGPIPQPIKQPQVQKDRRDDNDCPCNGDRRIARMQAIREFGYRAHLRGESSSMKWSSEVFE